MNLLNLDDVRKLDEDTLDMLWADGEEALMNGYHLDQLGRPLEIDIEKWAKIQDNIEIVSRERIKKQEESYKKGA